jgi:hypothetical protein
LVVVGTLFIPGCFHPAYDRPSCSLNGECPAGLVCNPQNNTCEGTGDILVDAAIDAVPDALTCFGAAPSTICLFSPPLAALVVSDPTTIDTSNSPLCAAIASGGNYCVLVGTTISVSAALRAAGPKPLVLLASDSITTTSTGIIDVGSHRGATPEIGAGGDPATCDDGTLPGSASSTSGGGAGGSFTGNGGDGGNGGGNGNSGTGNGGVGGKAGAVAAASITELRGGCAGQDGNGAGTSKGLKGHGGGAVLFLAGTTITIGGTVQASGEGGGAGVTLAAGGGGGGAGGMIWFDAPVVAGDGLLLANGGGGGGGSSSTAMGSNGADPTTVMAAIGGDGRLTIGGKGGNGSAGAAAGPGSPGAGGINDNNSALRGGGGGGGGGAGVIKAPAGASLGTQISPAVTP